MLQEVRLQCAATGLATAAGGIATRPGDLVTKVVIVSRISDAELHIWQVGEFDYANQCGKAKTKAIAQVTETDVATVVNRVILTPKTIAVAQIAESDVARAISHRRGFTITQVLELDAVRDVTPMRTYALARVNEWSNHDNPLWNFNGVSMMAPEDEMALFSVTEPEPEPVPVATYGSDRIATYGGGK